MGQYRATPEMKNKILQVSTKLFYEQGYHDTYFDQIAKECGITKPLITYHFKTKANLANEVLKKYLQELRNTVTSKIYLHYGEYNLQYSTAVDFQLMLRLYCEDANAYRFYSERLNNNFSSNVSPATLNLYKMHNRQYKLHVNNDMDEMTMITYASFASHAALITAFVNGNIKCTYQEFNDYTTALQFRLMRIDENQIEIIMNESKKIIKKMNFQIEPYFKIT